MPYRKPAWTAGRRTRSAILAGVVVVSAALIGVLGYRSSVDSSSLARSAVAAEPPAQRPHGSLHAGGDGAPGELPHPPHDRVRAADRGAAGEADGVVPDGVTVFDDEYPAVANLDPNLLRALRRAATEAADADVVFYVDSGWRSRKYQEQLFRETVSRYGSREQAARWVAIPGTSAHELGDAIDIGHSDATAWLSEQGAIYGLCQIYRNEPWHYELRPEAVDHGCPARYADPTDDPRMQK